MLIVRRMLLEGWGISVAAFIVGFMGPFGTWSQNTLLGRVAQWWLLLVGAYLLVRPAILGLEFLARYANLPPRLLSFWGVCFSSGPLAVIWHLIAPEAFRQILGYAGLIPFSLLCALLVLYIARWAGLEGRKRQEIISPHAGTFGQNASALQTADDTGVRGYSEPEAAPPLQRRLSAQFAPPILALQSEDHYVRVHGPAGSEMLLMRLRDAVAEMGQTEGEQVHRSWWVAKSSVVELRRAERGLTIVLSNETLVPVARDSVARLRSRSFLPDHVVTS